MIKLILLLLLLSNLLLLGGLLIKRYIHVVALQGVLLSLAIYFLQYDLIGNKAIILAVITLLLKGILFPALFLKGLQKIGHTTEAILFVGPALSMLLGLLFILFAVWVESKFGHFFLLQNKLIMVTSVVTALSGLLIIISRTKTFTQTIGYLTFENGIFLGSLGLVGEMDLMLEFGMSLDLFLALLVMTNAIKYIHQEYGGIDATNLSQLKG